jgi:hypothetical protein
VVSRLAEVVHETDGEGRRKLHGFRTSGWGGPLANTPSNSMMTLIGSVSRTKAMGRGAWGAVRHKHWEQGHDAH